MDSWERFKETSLPPQKSFYSELNFEDISDKGYLHAQKVWDVFGIRSLGEYHDLYVQTDTFPPGMRRRSDVSFWSHLGWDVADHIETSSRRHYWYVNEMDLFGTLSRRVTDT